MRRRSALVVLGAALAAASARADDRPPGAGGDKSGDGTSGGGDTAAEAPATFETLSAPARPIGDVGLLLGPLVDKCADDRREREIDRVRCRASTSYLKRILPTRTFSVVSDDPAAISLSEYNESIQGYRLALSACLACTNPLHVRSFSEPVFITLKKPVEANKGAPDAKGEESLAAAVEIAAVNLPFSSASEAQAWSRDVRPHLRAELVFSPAAAEWRFHAARGYAFTLVAARIVDRCTGAVVLSSPPSTALADRASAIATAAGDERCPGTPRMTTPTPAGATSPQPQPQAARPAGQAQPQASEDDEDGEEHLPGELSRGVIAEAMGKIRSQVFACYQRFHVPGSAPLTYEVAGNGTIQSIKLGGTLNGTPTGDCVLEAARGARFSRFDGPMQTFTYPFFLRR
jgi:hypothetical protein